MVRILIINKKYESLVNFFLIISTMPITFYFLDMNNIGLLAFGCALVSVMIIIRFGEITPNNKQGSDLIE